MNKIKKSLFIIIFITLCCSYASGLVTRNNTEIWYTSLVKSSISPPDWVFAPVWITLYVLMSFAVWGVYDKIKYIKPEKANHIIKLYYSHLLINISWPIIFFEFQLISLGLLNIIVLLFFIFYLMKLYIKVLFRSFILMVPYFLWVCFAGYLNFEIFRLN